MDQERLPLLPGPLIHSDCRTVIYPEEQHDLMILGVDPEDNLWRGGGAIMKYDLEAKEFQTVFEILTFSIAPISERVCVAVRAEGTIAVIRADIDQGVEVLPDLPNDESPQEVKASSDGCIWARSFENNWFEFEGSNWNTMTIGDIECTAMSIGSMDSIWMLGKKDSKYQLQRYIRENNSWQLIFDNLPGDGSYGIAACNDDSVWFVFREDETATIQIFRNDSWAEIYQTQAIFEADLNTLSSGSRNQFYVGQNKTIQTFVLGILDRLESQWPGSSDPEKEAYSYISKELGIVYEDGIRGEYTNKNQPFESWRTDIVKMERPAEIEPEIWESVCTQLLDELESVVAVYNLFDNLKDLNYYLGIYNATVLPGVRERIDLSEAEHGERVIDVIIGKMMKTAFDKIIGNLPAPYKSPAGIIATIIFTVIEHNTGKEGGDPNATFKIKFADLTKEMARMFEETQKVNENAHFQILSDWNRLNMAGMAIRSGKWRWPVQSTEEIAEPASAAYELYFYMSLMPARWQIVWWKDWLVNTGIRPPFPCIIEAPVHVSYWDNCRKDGDWEMWDVWVCNTLGGPNDACKSLETHPKTDLMSYIVDDLEQDPMWFFKGKQGWALPKVQGVPSP